MSQSGLVRLTRQGHADLMRIRDTMQAAVDQSKAQKVRVSMASAASVAMEFYMAALENNADAPVQLVDLEDFAAFKARRDDAVAMARQLSLFAIDLEMTARLGELSSKFLAHYLSIAEGGSADDQAARARLLKVARLNAGAALIEENRDAPDDVQKIVARLVSAQRVTLNALDKEFEELKQEHPLARHA